ncbi:MAG: glycosyltransferase family 4 protein [Abditibacteriota bacterium]|nr:glycosyltransferase family 4 protein [Abditibacteriota bacterium]
MRDIPTPIERRGTNPVKDFKLFLVYKKIIKDISPDVVFTYTVKPNIYGIKAASELKVPSIATVTGLGSAFQGEGFGKKILVLLYRWALHNASKVFFQNRSDRDTFVDLRIVDKKKSLVAPGSGVNTDDFSYKEYPNEDNSLNFLFVGRIMKEKGIDELFEVIEKLNENYNNLKFKFIGWYEDNYKDRVEQLVKKGYITYEGFQPDVRPFIEKCHCLVIPSYHEGMNNSLLEAQAMGRPVITTNVPGCKETLIDGETGFLCEVKSVESLYNRMVDFISLPYEEKINMGKRGRRLMVMKFRKEIVVDMYLEELMKIS